MIKAVQVLAECHADGEPQAGVEAVSGREGLDKSVDGGSSVGKAFRLRKRLHGLQLSRFAPGAKWMLKFKAAWPLTAWPPKACRSTPMWQLR
ncbi:hypothetical protein [Stutzerimonas stutzeri]|uniref:hypothetical protein n=1 Tax=Stutzerimonas stutzeri TaxID=316 RepID=UPI0012F79495|nr:hypothetical protein [Stutzerimonas stutzeri]